jgi:sporulation protein YlmC with PRC-barrel domain
MSSRLMRASEIAKRPVVTYGGEDVAQVKDIVYADAGGQVGGFTLNGRGRLSGPLKVSLPWGNVAALGPDAVMITDDTALEGRDRMLGDTGVFDDHRGGDVLGSRVLTDDGTDLGKVIDVIIEVASGRSPKAVVVGYEIEPSPALGKGLKKVLIPLPDTFSASGEHLMVPAAAKDFVTDDLAGFGAAIDDFRAQLSGTR